MTPFTGALLQSIGHATRLGMISSSGISLESPGGTTKIYAFFSVPQALALNARTVPFVTETSGRPNFGSPEGDSIPPNPDVKPRVTSKVLATCQESGRLLISATESFAICNNVWQSSIIERTMHRPPAHGRGAKTQMLRSHRWNRSLHSRPPLQGSPGAPLPLGASTGERSLPGSAFRDAG
jgi:hypothetical protein